MGKGRGLESWEAITVWETKSFLLEFTKTRIVLQGFTHLPGIPNKSQLAAPIYMNSLNTHIRLLAGQQQQDTA
jgi:hypothetical protein